MTGDSTEDAVSQEPDSRQGRYRHGRMAQDPAHVDPGAARNDLQNTLPRWAETLSFFTLSPFIL